MERGSLAEYDYPFVRVDAMGIKVPRRRGDAAQHVHRYRCERRGTVRSSGFGFPMARAGELAGGVSVAQQLP